MNVKWEYAWSKQDIRARLLAPQQGLLPYQKGGDGYREPSHPACNAGH